MQIVARLPKDRLAEGTIEWGGPQYVCRGKADNQKAIDHGNPKRDPRRPWGDHPAGRYVVTGTRAVPEDGARTYGPVKIVIQPLDLANGDECAARENAEAGDDGILIHGGAIAPDGVSLRATFGCLRVHNATARALAKAVEAALAAGERVLYTCELAA